MTLAKWWPIFVAISVILINWMAIVSKYDRIIENDHNRQQDIRDLKVFQVDQFIINKEINTKLNGYTDYMELVDSKYSRLCK